MSECPYSRDAGHINWGKVLTVRLDFIMLLKTQINPDLKGDSVCEMKVFLSRIGIFSEFEQ